MNLPVKLLFSLDEIVALQELRAIVFDGIRRALLLDGHCKHYEGTFQIQLPNHFEAEDGATWVELQLGCYVLGPTRHYVWRAESLGNAVRMARADVDRWIGELTEQEAEEHGARRLTP